MNPDRLEIGRIVRAHGLRGEVVVDAISNRDERFAPGSVLYVSGEAREIATSRRHQNRWLVRFDGIGFEDFSPTNFVAPPNRGTIAMLTGRDGVLWLALDRGAVVCLSGQAPRAFISELPSLIPNALAEDAEGSLYVTYRGGGICRIQNGKVSCFTESDGLPGGDDICAVASDNKGQVWFAKGGKLGRIREGTFETVHQFDVPRRLTSSRIAASKSGGVWLCLNFHLYKVEATGKLEDYGEFHPERAATVATAMIEDRDGAVWIGTSYNGLFRQDQSQFEPIETSHPEITALAEDREGNIWVGTAGGGLNRVRRRAVALEGTEAGLPFAAIQSICEDSAGNIWAATQNGVLVRRHQEKWAALAGPDWPQDVTAVAADPKGGIWIGSRLNGLHRWRDGKFVAWGDATELRGQTIHTLHVSKAGDLWIGEETPPGNPHAIERLRKGQLRRFDIARDSRVIRAMAEDSSGNIWAGTSKGVLFRITGDQLEEIRPRPEKELASIRCLHATPEGSLWIGYAGWGVGRLKDGNYTEIRTEHGLYDDYISHIVSDGHGWLWFGANRGIFKVSQADLDNCSDKTSSARVRSIHYGRGEGLPSLQANFGDSPDVLQSRDGRLWIPMRTALAVVDAARENEISDPPPVLLRRVLADERTAAWYSGVLPQLVSCDDGYSDQSARQDLLNTGIATVSISGAKGKRMTSEQDWEICERQQRGVNSSAYSPGPYSRYKEYNVDAFVQWYMKLLGVKLVEKPQQKIPTLV